MSFYFRPHLPAAVFSILVGMLFVLPPLADKIFYGVSFNSPVNIRLDDEFFYLARIHDVIDGHPALGNAYLWEGKTKPPSPFFLAEWILAKPLVWFHIPVVAGDILYDFIFTSFLVMLTYGAAFSITRIRWLSVAVAVFLFLGVFFGDFRRAVSPQFNFIFWLTLFWLAYMLVAEPVSPKKKAVLVFLSAANFGFLFYIYAYYAIFYFIFFVLLFGGLGWRRYWPEARRVPPILVGGLAAAAPYYFLFLKPAMALPEYSETLQRLGMINSHFPSGIAVVTSAAILIGVFLFLLHRRLIVLDRAAIFFLSGIAAVILSMNQHVLTGKNLEFSSHYYMLAVFWFTFSTAYLLVRLIEKGMVSGRHAALAAIVTVFFLSLPHYYEYRRWFGQRRETSPRQEAAPVLLWFEHNTKKDDVVYAPTLDNLIPIFTPDNVYYSRAANLSFMPEAEVIDRFILNNFYQEHFDKNFVIDNMRAIYGVYYIDVAAHNTQENKILSLFGIRPIPAEAAPQEAVQRVLVRFSELKAEDFEKELKRFRVDYLVWDKEVYKNAPFADMPFLSRAYGDNRFVIYRVGS